MSLVHLGKLVPRTRTIELEKVAKCVGIKLTTGPECVGITARGKSLSVPTDELDSGKKLLEVCLCQVLNENTNVKSYKVSFDGIERKDEICSLDPYGQEGTDPGSSYKAYLLKCAEESVEPEYQSLDLDQYRDADGSLSEGTSFPDDGAWLLEGVENEDAQAIALASHQTNSALAIQFTKLFRLNKFVKGLTGNAPFQVDDLQLLVTLNAAVCSPTAPLAKGPECAALFEQTCAQIREWIQSGAIEIDHERLNRRGDSNDRDREETEPHGAAPQFAKTFGGNETTGDSNRKRDDVYKTIPMSQEEKRLLISVIKAGARGAVNVLANNDVKLGNKLIFNNSVGTTKKFCPAMIATLDKVIENTTGQGFVTLVERMAYAMANLGIVNQPGKIPYKPILACIWQVGRSPSVFGFANDYIEKNGDIYPGDAVRG